MKNVRVTYRYPSWTHLQNVTEERGGDLRAVEGTEADLEVETDQPMRDGMLVLDDEQQIRLSGGEGNVYKGTVHMEKDGVYHVAALDQGQPVRLSNDFFIEARKAEPPNVIIARPGHDYRASPIEEVTVAVKADDEFGVSEMTLHYSVNGGPEQTVDLLKQKGVKQADGSTTAFPRRFQGRARRRGQPLRDRQGRAHRIAHRHFLHSGRSVRARILAIAGGGRRRWWRWRRQGDQNDISQREKEIIAETWKHQGDKKATQQEAADAAKFLSGVQAKLGDQARSLAGRMQSRELSAGKRGIQQFRERHERGRRGHGSGRGQLQQQKWKDAMPERTESAAEPAARRGHLPPDSSGVRQLGRRRRSGRRRRARPREPVRSGARHRKESVRDGADRGRLRQPAAKEIDEALQKLDQLARRQEELAQQQRNNQQSSEQRWQQEMLRREAEELQRQMEQMARNNGQSGSGSQSSSQQGGAQGNSSSGSLPGSRVRPDNPAREESRATRASSSRSTGCARRPTTCAAQPLRSKAKPKRAAPPIA